jgi:hypothetical protein
LNKIAEDFASGRHKKSEDFIRKLKIGHKLYAGQTTVPYVEWEAMVYSDSYVVTQVFPRIYRLIKHGQKDQLLQLQVFKVDAQVGPSEKWFIYSFEQGIAIWQHIKWKQLQKPAGQN